jgi:hypothetical protein
MMRLALSRSSSPRTSLDRPRDHGSRGAIPISSIGVYPPVQRPHREKSLVGDCWNKRTVDLDPLEHRERYNCFNSNATRIGDAAAHNRMLFRKRHPVLLRVSARVAIATSARNASLTDFESGNTSANSGSRRTTLTPPRHLLRTGLKSIDSGRRKP